MNRTDEEKTIDYANMGSSVTVINNLIAGDSSVIGDMTEARRKEKVKRTEKRNWRCTPAQGKHRKQGTCAKHGN